MVHVATSPARSASRITGQAGGDGGEIEVDETYIGGKARNMHKSKRQRLSGVLNEDKITVLGFIERGGKGSYRDGGSSSY